MLPELRVQGSFSVDLMINANYTNAHRALARLAVALVKRGQLIGRSKAGLSSKSFMVADGERPPILLSLATDNTNDYFGKKVLRDGMPKVNVLRSDSGCDADEFRKVPKFLRIQARIQSCSDVMIAILLNGELYKIRHGIEKHFDRLRDWCRLSTRYDRNLEIYLSVQLLAAIMLVWL